MRRALMLFSIVLATFGCKGTPKIVGTWKIESPGLAIPADGKAVISGDGTFVNTINFDDAKQGVRIVVIDKGTWTYDGVKLTSHFSDSDWQFDGPPAVVQAMKSRMAKRKQALLDKLNSNPTSAVKWQGDDVFSVTNKDGKTQTFQRIKGQ